MPGAGGSDTGSWYFCNRLVVPGSGSRAGKHKVTRAKRKCARVHCFVGSPFEWSPTARLTILF